jgi:predicted nucleotidyltransferase
MIGNRSVNVVGRSIKFTNASPYLFRIDRRQHLRDNLSGDAKENGALGMTESAVDAKAARAFLQERQRQHDQQRETRRLAAVQSAHAAARSVLPAFPQVRRAFLFGSAVRPGAMRRDSDIDIAIEGRLSPEDYLALWKALERAIPGWVVEVIELEQDVRFAERVRQTGELIYACSEH